jgi:hypothetical protein
MAGYGVRQAGRAQPSRQYLSTSGYKQPGTGETQLHSSKQKALRHVLTIWHNWSRLWKNYIIVRIYEKLTAAIIVAVNYIQDFIQ